MTPTDRWPAILLHLQGETWQRAADLAAALSVSERTIYRDMQALHDAGVPIQAVPGKGYRLREDYLQEPITLTTDEAIVLLVGSAQAAAHVDGRYRAAALAARTKLADRLPDAGHEKAGALQSSMRLVSEQAFGSTSADQTLHLLRRALVDERSIRFREAGTEATARRTMNPYGLVHRATAWHVVGYDRDAARVRHVRVDRIADLGFEFVDLALDRLQFLRQLLELLVAATHHAAVTSPSSISVRRRACWLPRLA